MPLTFIEISDYYLTISQGEQHYRQLGCCFVEADQVVFGESAWQQKFLNPQQSYSQYWQHLSYEKIHCANPDVEHFADLAYAQLTEALQQFVQIDKVVLMVSAHYSNEQLALLLGIVKACGLTEVRVIDQALAKVGCYYSAPENTADLTADILLMDIGLQQLTVSEIAVENELSLRQFQSYPNKGLVDLYKQLAVWINELYIVQYRYDIFDSANTEQDLHNQISAVLSSPHQQYQIRIHSSDNSADTAAFHQQQQSSAESLITDSTGQLGEKIVVISQQQLQQQLQLFFADVFAEFVNDKRLFLSAELASFITNTGNSGNWSLPPCTLLPQAMLGSSVTDYLLEQVGAEVELITAMPLARLGIVPSLDADNHGQQAASHLLHQDRILPLKHAMKLRADNHAKPFAQLLKVEHHWLVQPLAQAVVYVNNKPVVDRQKLLLGDAIVSSGSAPEYRLVGTVGGEDFYEV